MKSIVITGSSSGIGKATAKHFAAQGWTVAATMRKPENETELSQIENIKLYQLDVTDQASIDSTAAQILSDFTCIDVVLNNAGYGLAGPLRYLIGPDAEQMAAVRAEAGDDAFMAGMRQRMLA